MDNKSFKIVLYSTKDKEILFERLVKWSLYQKSCPDEVWFKSNKDIFHGLDTSSYVPSVISFRSFETETSPFTFTNMQYV